MSESASAFPNAYQRFWGPIRAKCMRLMGSAADADEVAQETFLRLWQTGPPLPPTGDARVVMAWLYRTCTHLGIDALRKRRRQQLGQHDNELDGLPCSVSLEQLVAAQRVIAVLHASVPQDELAAAVLCRVDGLSQLEAAEVLAVSERTLRRLLTAFDRRADTWKEESLS